MEITDPAPLTSDPARRADVAGITDALDPTLCTASKPPHLPAAMPFDRISPLPAQRWRRFGDEGEALFVVRLGGEMLAGAGEGGEAVWAVVGEVVRMAWFVEMRS